MRISIIGHSSSGKTRLAKQINEKFNIPHLQIDRLWFEAGGNSLKSNDSIAKERVRHIIKEKVDDFTQRPSWVSDGFYRRVQPLIASRADKIVFLDIPLWRRLLNYFIRVLSRENRHPELTMTQDFTYVYTIIRRTFTRKHHLKNFLKEHEVIVLKNRTEISSFFSSLTKD